MTPARAALWVPAPSPLRIRPTAIAKSSARVFFARPVCRLTAYRPARHESATFLERDSGLAMLGNEMRSVYPGCKSFGTLLHTGRLLTLCGRSTPAIDLVLILRLQLAGVSDSAAIRCACA